MGHKIIPMIFEISGYWKDDKSEFNDYIVTEWDSTPEDYSDENIFYYGLSEKDLQESCMEDGLDFVVTKYNKIIL